MAFSTSLNSTWLKKPLGKALVDPLLASLNKGVGKEQRLTHANVVEVTLDGEPLPLTTSAVCLVVRGPEPARVKIKLGPTGSNEGSNKR